MILIWVMTWLDAGENHTAGRNRSQHGSTNNSPITVVTISPGNGLFLYPFSEHSGRTGWNRSKYHGTYTKASISSGQRSTSAVEKNKPGINSHTDPEKKVSLEATPPGSQPVTSLGGPCPGKDQVGKAQKKVVQRN